MNPERIQIRRIVILLAFAIILAQPFLSFTPVRVEADPDTITVPDDHPTIQYAIDNATEGDIIFVRNGTYKESITVNKRLTIHGEDKATTFIDGMQGGDAVRIDTDDVQFFGFTVFNASDDGIQLSYVNGTVIYECNIHNCSGDGIYVIHSDYASIENCTIYDISTSGIYLYTSHGALIGGCEINYSRYGIRISNSHDALITGCDVHNNTNRGIYVLDSLDVWIVECNIYNNTYEGIYTLASDYAWIEDCDIYNNSGWEALYLDRSDHAHVVGSRIYDNYDDGIYLYGSDNAIIVDCNAYNNKGHGMNVRYSDHTLIKRCDSFNNYYGIHLRDSDHSSIKDSYSYNNTRGVYLSSSDVVSICNCTLHNNTYCGLYNYDSLKMYVARSAFFNNSDDGLYLSHSSGVVANCNFTDNQDRGIHSSNSVCKARYCSFEGNKNYGVYSGSLSSFNATENWWGNETGPYHSSLNPAGTGDTVSSYVEFDPWQTELYQPETLISDLRCQILHADVNTTYYVPTGNIYDDSAFYAFYAYKENPQIITPPTQSSASDAYLNPDGSPKFTGDIITFGGRYANRMVAYYEDAGTAIVGYGNNGTHHLFTRISDASHIYAVDLATYNESEKDYFVFQIYRDGDRWVLSEWGICAEGTYAGGLCFIDIILPYVGSYTNTYYIFSWTDSNGDGMPQPEEIAVETSGN